MRLSGIRNRTLWVLLAIFLCIPLVSAHGQDQPSSAKRRKETPVGVPTAFPHKWLDEDVRYIITDQERADFSKLITDDQRDQFVEDFWARRNPTPQSPENPYKEEHYRRIAYTNTHFAAHVPGYRTDRGRFYIIYGPPDSVDSKSGFTPPSETWHYLFVEGIGRNVVLSFADKCACGDYQLSQPESDPRVPVIFDPLRK
jgi:GWxTD domain-containing protein